MSTDPYDIFAHLRRTTATNDDERKRLLRQGRAVFIDRGHIAVDVPFDRLPRWQRDRVIDLMRVHAVLSKNPCSVASRTSAVLLHGLWTRAPLEFIDLASNRRSGNAPRRMPGLDGVPGRGPTVRRHHFSIWGDDDITVVDSLLVTTLRRTVRDCLLHEPASTALFAAISAARLHARVRDRWDEPRLAQAQHFLDGVRDDLRALPRGYRGVRRALVLLEAADPRIESPGEALTLVFARAVGLPQPQAQARFHVGGKDYYGDLWFKELGLLAEYDGRQKYADADNLIDEKTREDALRALPEIHAFHRITSADMASRSGRRALERRFLESLPLEAHSTIVPCSDFGDPR